MVPPPIKHLAYAALADLFVNLPLSKANPEDVNVRQKLQIASWMSLWPQRFEKYRYGLAPTDSFMAHSQTALSASPTLWDTSSEQLTAFPMESHRYVHDGL